MSMNSTKRWLVLGAVALSLTPTACSDLTLEPKSQITSGNIFTDAASYRSFIAKLYGGLAVTGQEGPAGNPDISGIDEGFSQYVRTYWQLQELPTDEAVIGWNDIGLPELMYQTWSANNVWTTAMYSRIFYQIALANEFLRQTTDAQLSSRGTPGEVRTAVQGYRAEARFLRALSYYHAVDLFGPVPIVDENFNVGRLPVQSTRAEVTEFIESELRAVMPQLPATSTGEYYGRASQAAANMILAHLFINAPIWAGNDRASDARIAAEAVIATPGLSLDPNYLKNFSADNHTSPEVIFSVPFDGVRTRTWGGTTFLAHAAVGADMDAGAYGIDGGWYGLRLRQEAVDRYEGGAGGPDRRTAYFATLNRTKAVTEIGNNSAGYAAPKYRNVTASGAPGSNSTFPDTDFPLFRLADAYLLYAEAVLRGGGGSRTTALNYVNLVRRRAYGGTAGDITDAQLTLDFILAERGRELLWEGFRRQDLIRFGLFSTGAVWSWKGGVPAGRATEAFRDLYPIPSNELSANPTLTQNPGY